MTHVENPNSVSVVENPVFRAGWLRGSPVRGASYIVPDKFYSENPRNLTNDIFFSSSSSFLAQLMNYVDHCNSNLNMANVILLVLRLPDLTSSSQVPKNVCIFA